MVPWADGDGPELARLPSELIGDLKTLNAFFEQVSLFVKWWDWVQTETDPSREKQPIEYQLDALRDSATVARWKEMEVKYMCYARMVGPFQILVC